MIPPLLDSLASAVIRAATRVREVVQRGRIDRELDEELQFHLDQEVEHHKSKGMSDAEARRAAAASFGGMQRFREETREARGYLAIEMLARDFRRAIRRLSRSSRYSAGVASTLAVAFAATAAVGTLVYGVVLRPLPYPDPDRLVRVSLYTPGLGVVGTDQSEGTYLYLRERARSYSALGAYSTNEGVTITEGDAPERVRAAIVTPNVFSILLTVPAAGRLLTEEDARADTISPVMISYDLWQRRFGGDPRVVGRWLELNRRRRLIAGVLPARFDFPASDVSVYYPNYVRATTADLASRASTTIGRLAPGVSIPQAQAELNTLVSHLHERFTELSPDLVRTASVREVVQPLRAAMVAPVRSELTLLALMVVALLLIATANAATLTLLRAERLRGEAALSRALGASTTALLRRFITEGIVLALAAALVSLPLAVIGVATHLGFTNAQIPRLHEIMVSPALVVGIIVLATLAGVLLGAVAASRATSGVVTSLRCEVDTLRPTRGRAWRRTQDGLVGFQIALTLSLLIGASLMISSFVRLRGVNLGFSPGGATTFTLMLPYRGYSTYQRTAAFDLSVAENLRRIPGVSGVGIAMQLPSTPQLLYVRPRIEAVRGNGEVAQALATANIVSADFFATMSIPMRAGRTFAPGDLGSSTPGVVLGAALARALFGSENPVGREVRLVSRRRYPSYRVVGVSGEVYGDRVIEGPLATIYFPLLGDLAPGSTEKEDRIPFMPAGVHFIVRSDEPLDRLAPAFRRAVASVDSRVPIWGIQSLDVVVAETMARHRLTMMLIAVAALATLLLGVIGVASTAAYAVEGRAFELAMRMALGATPSSITLLIFRDSARLIIAGVCVGLIVSVTNAHALRAVLFEVSPTDPWSYVVTTLFLGLVAGRAAYRPAQRASQQDPATVFRT